MIALVNLLERSRAESHYLEASKRSLSVVTGSYLDRSIGRLPTVLSLLSSPRAVGVHRYKLEHMLLFLAQHPYVEVPNLPVDVDSWGR